MSDRAPIREAKRRLPLPALMASLGLGEHAKKSAKCFMHEDLSNSFSIWQGKDGMWNWKCHAGCGHGDEITLLEKVKEIPNADAVRLFLKTANVQPEEATKRRPKEKAARRVAFKWPARSQQFLQHVAPVIAQERGYSFEFVVWLHEQNLACLYNGGIGFPNHDETGKVVSCHYRSGRKWLFDPQGFPTRPLLFGDTVTPEVYLIFESQWDAFAVADKFGVHLPNPILRRRETGPVKLAFIVTRGAGNGKLIKGLIPAGSVAYAWKQNDELKNGIRAADEWLKEVVASTDATVQWARTPDCHKDVNDWTRAGGTVNDLLDALHASEKVTRAKGLEENSKTFSQLAVTPSQEPEPTIKPEAVYYDIARKEYLVADARGRWMGQNEAQFRRRCKMRGISTRAGDNVLHSAFDAYVTELQDQHGVDFVGPLAGHPAGLHSYEGRRLLITTGPTLLKPVPGDWSMLHQVFENVLGDTAEDQLTFWHGWVRTTIDALYARQHKPGQAVVLIGPAEGGKSLLQDLATVMFGNREAKPYRYMTGIANFNGEMVGAEHLRIGDENPHTDIRARRTFGAQIKNIVVEATQRIESKYYEAMILKPFWRLTISLNDEPENLMILPPLDEHTLDKLMLFKARKEPMPMPTATPDQKAAFWSKLTGELPHYLHWLLHEWSIPAELVSQRYGVTHFHHPAIVDEVEGFEPHRELRGLIDAEIFAADATTSWRGTADDLERELTQEGSRVYRAAKKLLDWRGACARYLGRLAKEKNPTVKEARTNQKREWIIERLRQ